MDTTIEPLYDNFPKLSADLLLCNLGASEAGACHADAVTEHDDRPLWLIEIAVLASKDEVRQLTQDLIATICPDSSHEGDCSTPWALTTISGASFSARKQAVLRESIRLTNPDPADFQ